jgi:hypothetical protein
MALRLRCSYHTVKQAVAKDLDLKAWAQRSGPAPRTAVHQKFNDVALSAAQSRELDPADAVADAEEPDPSDDASSAEMSRLLKEAGREERAFLNRLDDEQRKWYVNQPAGRRISFQKKWKQFLNGATADEKDWFLKQSLTVQLEHLDDPGKYRKIYRKA